MNDLRFKTNESIDMYQQKVNKYHFQEKHRYWTQIKYKYLKDKEIISNGKNVHVVLVIKNNNFFLFFLFCLRKQMIVSNSIPCT